MMRQPLSFLVITLILIGAASAIAIEGNEFLVADYLTEDVEEVVFEATPPADTIVTVSLTGSNGYAPELKIFNDDSTVPHEVITADRGKTASSTFLSRGDRADPVLYRFVIVIGDGLPGADYAFTYTAAYQNDSGLGADAPERFEDAPFLEMGMYKGFLGGDDQVDLYSLNVLNGETITFMLTAAEEGSLGFKLIDEGLVQKIDTRKSLYPKTGDATLTTTFTSTKDQTVKLNINGDVPYTLLLETDKEEEPKEPVVLPPMPPTPPPAAEPAVVPPEEESNESFLLLLIVIVLLASGGVIGILSWRMKKKKPAIKKRAKKK